MSRISILMNTLDSSHNYYYQIQGLMYITGNQSVDLSFTLCVIAMKVLILRDEQFIQQMVQKLDVFCNDVYKKVVLDRFLYRSANVH